VVAVASPPLRVAIAGPAEGLAMVAGNDEEGVLVSRRQGLDCGKGLDQVILLLLGEVSNVLSHDHFLVRHFEMNRDCEGQRKLCMM